MRDRTVDVGPVHVREWVQGNVLSCPYCQGFNTLNCSHRFDRCVADCPHPDHRTETQGD